MIIKDICIINGMTLCRCSEQLPFSKWNRVKIKGVIYEPLIVYDAGDDTFAIKGVHDFCGEPVEFS